MAQPKFRIYSSLLDKFQDLLDYEIVAESPWNKLGDEYKLTPDEMAEKIELELLAMVYREPGIFSEAADKGTCFNEIVDCLIEKRPCRRDDMTIRTLRGDDGTPIAIEASVHDFTFKYDVALCRDAASYFKGALTQQFLKAPLGTAYGTVELYGYADEWVADKIYDIKTTGKYDFGKFERKWQRHVYPYCAIESGLTEEVSEFEYSVYQLNKAPVIGAQFYRETYTYDHAQSTMLLRQMCERFIEWLLQKDDEGEITDRKIFNEQQLKSA